MQNPHVVCANGKIYSLLGCLGAGQFGQVFEAYELISQDHHQTTGELVVKFLENTSLYQFEQEHTIMQKMKGTKDFSQIIDKGVSDSFHTLNLDVDDQTRFFVIKKLGTSLMEVFESSNQKLMKIDVLKIGIELLKLIEKMHAEDIIHQDIKFDNILLSEKIPKSKISKYYINSHFEKLDNIQRQAHHLMKS